MIARFREDGFTLIELAVVVVIIGILAGIAMPNYAKTRSRATRSVCLAQQRHIRDAATLYAVDHGLRDTVLNCDVLYEANAITARLAECPESQEIGHDDYDITLEGGRVTAVRCNVAPFDHSWAGP